MEKQLREVKRYENFKPKSKPDKNIERKSLRIDDLIMGGLIKSSRTSHQCLPVILLIPFYICFLANILLLILVDIQRNAFYNIIDEGKEEIVYFQYDREDSC